MDFKDFQLKLSKKQRELLTTVETGTLSEVQEVALRFRNLNKHESFNYILLLTALRREHKSISKFLIKEDCRVQGPTTGTYCTPLYYAVKMNDFEIFKALLKKGASAFAKDVNTDTALELAIHENRWDLIDLILDEKRLPENADNLQCNFQDDIALFHAACWSNSPSLIQIFLSRGFSVQSRSSFSRDDWSGLTPLHFALKNYSADEAITILLEHGADFLAKDEKGRTPLHFVFRANEGRFPYYEHIIRKNLTIPNKRRLFNPIDEYGLSHFHMICTMNFQDEDSTKNWSYIKYFIDNKVDLNSSVSLEDKQFPGFTALLFAAKEYSWDALKLLLENGADPQKTDKNGLSPLHLVCRDIESKREQQRLEIVRLLLQCGADPNVKDSEDRTPLHTASWSPYEMRALNDLQKLLLSKNPQGMNHTDKSGLSYLHIACTGNDLGIVKILVANGASVNSCIHSNSPRYSGYSALHFAVKFGRVSIVQFLLSHGADVNIVNKAKATPLHLACDHTSAQFYEPGAKNDKKDAHFDWLPSRKAHIRIINLLVQGGAYIDAKNVLGETPLLVNCQIPRDLLMRNFGKSQAFSESKLNEVTTRQKMIMDFLLELGADINSRCNLYGSILHILIPYYCKVPLVKNFFEIALKKGIDASAIGGVRKLTPLHMAVEESMEGGVDTSLIDLLLDYGANINAQDEYLNTPLHTALRFYRPNETTLARLLNHPDIDINAQTCKNETPLHMAMALCNVYCTKKLLVNGANVNLKDDNGRSPVHDLLERLEEFGDDDAYTQEVFFVVAFHLKILMKLKLNVSEEISKVIEAVLKYLASDCSEIIDFVIDEELDYSKSKKIDSYTSLYDIIFKDSNAMATHVLNRSFQDIISSIRKGVRFSIFDNIIERQFNKGLKRIEILKPAKSALNSITKVNWPDCCSERILNHLNDDNLEDLIKITYTPGERKRLCGDFSSLGGSMAKIRRRNK